MKYWADLHIHSKYSIATSKDCCPEHLELWARRKGLTVIGTGDFTHPAWREELREKLIPAEDGLWRLKPEYRVETAAIPGAPEVRFIVSGEISLIYKKNGRTRKVHHLLLLPGLEAAERLAGRLEKIGNIAADGRPILGLDSRALLEITLETCAEAIFIPAHIWTPHFSLFGANSGFDAIEECFEDLTPEITALETGLSSDPAMNWQLSALDRFLLVSNSDAHSPANLAREANLFATDLSYPAIRKALTPPGEGFLGTVEFFPEEGKYHWDGHRACGVRWAPAQTREYQGVCPVCGRKVTTGVLHRVEALGDRAPGEKPAGARRYERLVPLAQVIAAHGRQADVLGHSMGGKAAMMLALKPRLVRQSKARDFASSSQQRARDFALLGNGKSAKLAWAAQDLNPDGAAGNASAANVDDGLALVDAAGRALAALLVEIDRLPADTLRGR